MLFRCTVHPRGLDPFQAAKAWHLRIRDGLTWKEVRAEVRTINGAHPGQEAVEDAVGEEGSGGHPRSVSQELGCAEGRPLVAESAQCSAAAFA